MLLSTVWELVSRGDSTSVCKPRKDMALFYSLAVTFIYLHYEHFIY